jgi:hypothetical protein
MKESAIERHLVERIRKIGGECFKFVSPGRVGMPDRLVVLPGGEICWVELKTPTGKVSPEQLRTHKRLRELDQDVQIFRTTELIDKYFPLE